MADHNENLADYIDQAVDLLKQKSVIQTTLASVRQLVRLTVDAGFGSPEQIAWVDENLPKKSRQSAEERIEGLQKQLADAVAKAKAK